MPKDGENVNQNPEANNPDPEAKKKELEAIKKEKLERINLIFKKNADYSNKIRTNYGNLRKNQPLSQLEKESELASKYYKEDNDKIFAKIEETVIPVDDTKKIFGDTMDIAEFRILAKDKLLLSSKKFSQEKHNLVNAIFIMLQNDEDGAADVIESLIRLENGRIMVK